MTREQEDKIIKQAQYANMARRNTDTNPQS